MQEWENLVEEMKTVKQIIDTNFPQHLALVKYLDKDRLLQQNYQNVLHVKHELVKDIEFLENELEKINQMMGELENLFQKKELLLIIERIPKLLEFKGSYNKLKYLSNLQNSENFLYKTYEPILKIAATSQRKFSDFT